MEVLVIQEKQEFPEKHQKVELEEMIRVHFVMKRTTLPFDDPLARFVEFVHRTTYLVPSAIVCLQFKRCSFQVNYHSFNCLNIVRKRLCSLVKTKSWYLDNPSFESGANGESAFFGCLGGEEKRITGCILGIGVKWLRLSREGVRLIASTIPVPIKDSTKSSCRCG